MHILRKYFCELKYLCVAYLERCIEAKITVDNQCTVQAEFIVYQIHSLAMELRSVFFSVWTWHNFQTEHAFRTWNKHPEFY